MERSLREGVKIVFADGETREIAPLTIRQLRKFMKAVDGLELDAANINDETIDKMVAAAAVALEKSDPALAENSDALEDALDLRCFNELLSAAMGTDPNE